jgi:hypothetical protein
MRLRILFTVAGLLIIGALQAQRPRVFSSANGAINGYDAVAYFTDSSAVKGFDSLSYHWESADWKFSSKTNLELFKKDPNKFAPMYGGYCAFGMSRNYKAPTSPDAWTIVNGKLYLNYNKDVRTTWQKEVADRINKADENWKLQKDK